MSQLLPAVPQISEQYPSGRVVKQVFGSDGDLIRVFGKNVNRPEQTYASGFRYATHGAVDQMRLGNGLWETAKFNIQLQTKELGLGYSNANFNPLLRRSGASLQTIIADASGQEFF